MPIFVDLLPTELLDLIFKDLSTDEAALKSCSLTHRSWVAPSRKYIFAELFVGRDKRFEDHKLDVEMCQRLFDVLETSPHIASYFTRVTVWVHPDSDSSTKKAKLLSKILPQLTHVRSLILQSGINLRLHYAHLQSYLRQAITELISNSSFESLTLHEWIFADDASNYVELIDHSSETLKYLSVSNLYFNACLDQSDDPIDLPLELPNLQEYRIRSALIFVHKQLFTFPKLARISWPMHKKGGDEDEECASDYTLAGMSRKPSHWSFHILCDDMSEGLPLCPTLPKDRLSAVTHLGLSLDTGYSTTFTIKALEHLNDILPTNSGSQIESIIVTFYLGCQPYWMWEEDQWEEVIDALVPILNGNTPDDNDVETQRSAAFVFKIGTWTTPEEPTPEIAEMIEEFGDDDDPLYTDAQNFPGEVACTRDLPISYPRENLSRTDHVDSARSNALVPIPHACPLTVILLDDMEKARGPFGDLTSRSPPRPFFTFGALSLLGFTFLIAQFSTLWPTSRTINLPHNAAEISARCQSLKMKAGPAADFEDREESDRFVPGAKPYLITDARIWTGLENGTQVIRGDIIVDKGVIKGVGHFGRAFRAQFTELEVIDAQGKWVTPGIVDMHSHLGDASSPELEGAADDNSLKGTAQPWLRSLDGLNTHDDSYPLSISGGITTALVLPGSANAIGGQAYLIKLRETAERTPSSMLLEAPYQINSSFPDPSLPLHWRHMKHACGENPSRVYEDTRMDTIWAFRKAYNHAREIKQKQDAYCERVEANSWAGLGEFPEDLQWEALVDVLRGRVKVNIHCYETVDLDALVRISNEFQFPIAAFHHAHEAYLVPDTLKKAYGAPPTIALFATNARYKKEAYRGSEFAPRILTSHGLKVAMKSDHPVLNSRFLLYEAQQAYFYGMPENSALAAVITTSAEAVGMGHRLGYIRQGWDADLVLWDSHPLALGATPIQVFIDGIPQLDNPFNVQKPASFQHSPKVPNFDDEAEAAIHYR
ncbi:hypothetical protein ONZ45_g12505 [Pleurotus djamor]|nr:hypothetical protein ONZ45_g12505 [Pleurotus djamor]